MTNLLLIIVCLTAGVLLRLSGQLPERTHQYLNHFVLKLSLPALTLFHISRLEVNWHSLLPVSAAWLSLLLAWLLFSFLGKYLGWSRSLVGALVLCAGFGNTSFIGIPLMQALFADTGLQTAILFDQPGSFAALSSVGIVLAYHYSGQPLASTLLFKKVLSFPPFMAFLLALLVNVSGVALPASLAEILAWVGASTVPVALLSVGMQLRWQAPGDFLKPLLWGLGYKLLLLPALVLIIYRQYLPADSTVLKTMVMEAAMAPMITAALIAASLQLTPRLCQLMIGIGTPLSVITLGIWYWLLV